MDIIKHFETHPQYRWFPIEIDAELEDFGIDCDITWLDQNLWYRNEIVAKLKELLK